MQSPTSAGEDRPPRSSSRLGSRRTQTLYGILAAAFVGLGVVLLVTSPAHKRSPRPPSSAPGNRPLSALARLPACGAECDPIDPRYLTDVAFGRTSFWIQPWRAYLDTWPAARLRESLGINFNVKSSQAAPVARLLHDSGFTYARIGLFWDRVSYDDPRKLSAEADVRTKLTALHTYGLRPLFVLNSNSFVPCPTKQVTLETVAPASAGASTVRLSPSSAAAAVPGQTGFNPRAFFAPEPRRRRRPGAVRRTLTPQQRLARRQAARAARRAAVLAGRTQLALHGTPGILITNVGASGVATLSRPLPASLPAGAHRGTTLLYAPFAPPKLSNGAPNPAFLNTMGGWLRYVATVNRVAQSIFGPGGYDLEIWNELGFGSAFLSAVNYYAAPSDPAALRARMVKKAADTRAVVKALLDDTVAYARDPANGISSSVGISDGFASQTPFSGGAFAPKGMTALSKHPYVSALRFPAEYHARRTRAVNALGESDRASTRSFTPLFVPTYQALLPESTLTATSTETLTHDIAPITTTIYRAPHGRYVGPRNGAPVQKWITEYNLGLGNAPVMGPDEVTPQTGTSATLGTADKEHFHAKALLRSLVAMISKGISREYFFAAAPGALSLIGEGFFKALEAHPGSYPGARRGGAVLAGFHRMLGRFQGPGPGGAAQQLKLLSITQDGTHAQFNGDGTPAHPSLYDREVLAVFPYQTSPTRYVVPIYVMTKDLLTLYEPGAPSTNARRFDLPDETFHVTLGNLPPSASPPTVSAYDPLRDQATPARLTSRQGGTAVFEVAATDYPRLLTIDYRAGS